MGGGGQAYLGIFPKFLRYFMMAPLNKHVFGLGVRVLSVIFSLNLFTV